MTTTGVFRDGAVHVRAEQCTTCVFHPGNRMRLPPGRLAGMASRDPLPLLGTQPVGRITDIRRVGHLIWAKGDLEPDWDLHMVDTWRPGQPVGLAVSVTPATDERDQDQDLLIVRSGAIAGATLTDGSPWPACQLMLIREAP